MNKLFQRIQFFVECRDAESIEPMGNLVKIVSHPRNAANELHIFGFDTTLYLSFGDELSQKLGTSNRGFTCFSQQGVVLHCVKPKKHLIFPFL